MQPDSLAATYMRGWRDGAVGMPPDPWGSLFRADDAEYAAHREAYISGYYDGAARAEVVERDAERRFAAEVVSP